MNRSTLVLSAESQLRSLFVDNQPDPQEHLKGFIAAANIFFTFAQNALIVYFDRAGLTPGRDFQIGEGENWIGSRARKLLDADKSDRARWRFNEWMGWMGATDGIRGRDPQDIENMHYKMRYAQFLTYRKAILDGTEME